MEDVSRGVGTGVSVGRVVGVAVGSGVEVGVGVCVEVGGGVRVEVGEGVWVVVGSFASAAGVALNVQVGVDLGGEVAVLFPVEGRTEAANDRTASTPVSANTQALVTRTRSKATTILFFIN
jgi:hypothetical protein